MLVFLALQHRRRLALFVVLAAGACALLALCFPVLFPRVESIDVAWGQRFSIWKTSLLGILEHPLLGQGAAAYRIVGPKYGGYITFHSHNLLLDGLLNFGLIGMGVFAFYGFTQARLLRLRFQNNIGRSVNVLAFSATAAVLAEHPRIVGMKEASGNISQIAELAAAVRGRMDIYSGNDDQIVPILSLGGKGVISVLSNPMPAQTVEICRRFFAGDVAGSAALQLELLPYVQALFCEVNPIPVKAAMAAMGFCENVLRLPLTPMEPAHEAGMLRLMRELGLLPDGKEGKA